MDSRRPTYHIDLGHLNSLNSVQSRTDTSASSSPIEASQTSNSRFPQSSPSTFGSLGNTTNNRLGAGSPSHEHSGRPYSRRAREIQASEGISHQVWGPPTASGLSTPLRETIPESPGDDTFPDLPSSSLDVPSRQSSFRRTRAGTVPSRFPPGTETPPSSSQHTQTTQTSRPTPSESPFRSGTASVPEADDPNMRSMSSAALLSRLRAGSGPPRSSHASQSPYGTSLFSSSWNPSTWNRDRAGSLMSYTSGDLSSPTQSTFRDSMADTDVKTLDYLGLVDPPTQNKSPENTTMNMSSYGYGLGARPLISDLNRIPSGNRFRSYSVNAKEKYDDGDSSPSAYPSGTLTPAQTAAAALAATQAQIHKHNLDVQAFVNQATSNRPRARTAGLLDSPASRMWKSYVSKPSRLDSSMIASEYGLDQTEDYQSLANAVQALQLQGEALQQELATNEEKSRALWLGGIPTSTTSSSLKVIFEAYGKIESARVLTHKNCGFINFENLESAIRAKSQLNAKEIFPGAGPVRIGYAKAPSASGTPGTNGIYPSPSPDFTTRARGDSGANESAGGGHSTNRSVSDGHAPNETPIPHLEEVVADIIDIVKDFGATDEEQMRISEVVEQACQFDSYAADIPPISEPSQNRLHDAPKLRDIRKRIDNNTCTPMEIQEIAIQMLPEIAELSSDYLGNTVVQKLFEFCSEEVKEAMLREIGPHLAEIGVHKNGTWAAQKIIDVARTPAQIHVVVESLRPYSVGCFLDQYGNYVMQCCLRFGYPWNSFIFEGMLCRLWHIAQGRFGARAMRACLESHHATKDQQRMVAAAIAIHSVRLATNANGALLLTWFLDTCSFPHRRAILAPRLIPHLVRLCTHKVAYLTVLKLINQRSEPEARDALLKALFFSPDNKVLTDILKDHSCGATLIFKVLTTPFFEEEMRSEVVQNIRKVLLEIKAQPNQGYKRLMDEVGLSTRSATNGTRDSSNSGNNNNRDGSVPQQNSKQGPPSSNASQPQPGMLAQMNGYGSGPVPAPHGANSNLQAQMGGHLMPNGQFDGPPFSSNHNMTAPVSPQSQMPYHSNMMAPQRRGGPPPPPPQPLMYNFPPQPVMNGYSNSMPQPMEPYRNMPRNQMGSPQGLPMPQSPMMPQAGYGQPAYSPVMGPGAQGMWQYPNPYMMPPQQQMQVQGMMGANGMGGGRRGRR